MTKLTPKRLEKALELIEAGENIIDVAEAINVTRQALYQHRKRDEEFAKAWDDALETGDKVKIALHERAADQRAIEGWDEPVFYEGQLCGYKRRYSDGLLIARLKALAPEKYAERSKHEHSGQVDTGLIVVGKPAADEDEWHAKHSGS